MTDHDDRLPDGPPDDIQQEIDAALANYDDDQAQLDAMDAAAARARDVQTAVYRLEIQEEARRKKAAAERGHTERPQPIRLDRLLATEFHAPLYRIDELWPAGGNIMCNAPWKAGKSTMVGNIIRALVDGDPFLDKFLPTQARHVLLIDNELDPPRLQRWLRDQDITNADRVTLLSLKGRVAAFDIIDPAARAEWVAELADLPTDAVVLDCLRPILDAFGLDEHSEAGKFLVPFDAFLREVGPADGCLVHHMGHTAERSRGDSRLLDWPDAVWKIVRDKDDESDTGMDDPQGSRYFSAYGRDVDLGQTELIYNPADRRLSLGSKSRHQATETRKLLKADNAVIAVVKEAPDINKTKLRKGCAKYGIHSSAAVDEAVERLVEDGVIVRKVIGQQHLHSLADRAQMLDARPTATNRDVTVNQPLTWDDAPTATESETQGQTRTDHNRDRNGPIGRIGNRDRALLEHGHGNNTPTATSTPSRSTFTPCPHCDLNPQPPGADMCNECADRLIRESEPDD